MRLLRQDRSLPGLTLGRRPFVRIEPQPRLPLPIVRAVTFEAELRQNRPHITTVVGGVGGSHAGRLMGNYGCDEQQR